MKNALIISIFSLICLPAMAHAGWVMDWAEECNNPNLQPELRLSVGWDSTPEGTYFTDREKNFHVENGNCVFTVHKEQYSEKEHTGARINTVPSGDHAGKLWTYGAFEARFSWPEGRGYQPAFWLDGNPHGVGWPSKGEIDVMEARGQRPDQVFSTLIGPKKGNESGHVTKSTTAYCENTPCAGEMHTYRLEWEPDSIRFYLDGKKTSEWNPDTYPGEWVFNNPMYVDAFLAMDTPVSGPPDETTPFPGSMHLDYIRVYQWDEDNNEPPADPQPPSHEDPPYDPDPQPPARAFYVEGPENGTAVNNPITLGFEVNGYEIRSGDPYHHIHVQWDNASIKHIYNTDDFTLPALSVGEHNLSVSLVENIGHVEVLPTWQSTFSVTNITNPTPDPNPEPGPDPDPVTPGDCPQCDINQDGKTDIRDVYELTRYIVTRDYPNYVE